MRACPVCGITFPIPAGPAQFKVYCSAPCRNQPKQRRADMARGRVRKHIAKPKFVLLAIECADCEARFIPTHPLQRYCCISCRHRHNANVALALGKSTYPGWTPGRQATYQRRRALLKGATAPGEFIVPADVYDRDGWICGLCDTSVDPSLKYPDPMSVSLDHIVPVSLGGMHAMSNVQCSHLFCNLSNNNRVASEVPHDAHPPAASAVLFGPEASCA